METNISDCVFNTILSELNTIATSKNLALNVYIKTLLSSFKTTAKALNKDFKVIKVRVSKKLTDIYGFDTKTIEFYFNSWYDNFVKLDYKTLTQ